MPTPAVETPTYTLHHADALNVLRDLPNESVDAVVTDSPYSSGGIFKSHRSSTNLSKKYQSSNTANRYADFAGDNRDQRSFGYWTQLWQSECLRVTKPGGYLLTFSDWRQLPISTDAMQAAGWIWRGIIAWDKGGSARAPHKGYFRHQAEYIAWGTRGKCEIAQHDGPYPGVIFARAPRVRSHMTQKPLNLMRQLVRIVPPGGIILDPFGGSHSTGVAALAEGRRYIGIELDDHYHAVGAERLRAATDGQVFDLDMEAVQESNDRKANQEAA